MRLLYDAVPPHVVINDLLRFGARYARLHRPADDGARVSEEPGKLAVLDIAVVPQEQHAVLAHDGQVHVAVLVQVRRHQVLRP